MSSTPHFREELNRVAWPLLVAVAQRRETMTYQDLATAINRTLKTDYQSHLVGSNALDLIERYCIRKGLPDLTAMVVRKDDDLPGPDFYRANGCGPT